MLVRYFRRPSRIEQLRSSTGGHLLEGFAKELSQGRYQWVAARKHIRAAEHFLHWIAHRNLSIVSVEERYAPQFLDHLKRCCCRGHLPPLEPHRQKYSVDLWFDCLRRVGIVPTPTFVEPAVEAPMLTSFCDWMRRERGVSDATLSIYRFELRAFIKDLGEDPHMYDARNLRQFVLDKSQQSGWASARKCICAVRMFLRFLISRGRCPDYLYASIPTFAHWRLSALPFYLQADQVEQVIASPDLATSLGRRNRAILLLLARLGLRAIDIVRLRLDDLDWKEGMILVSCPRTVARHENGPLHESRRRYPEHLSAEGAALHTLRGAAGIIYRAAIWMKLDESSPVERKEVELAAKRWAHRSYRNASCRGPELTEKEFRQTTCSWLRFAGRLRESDRVHAPHQEEIDALCRYSDVERGLSPATIATVRQSVRKFFKHIRVQRLSE